MDLLRGGQHDAHTARVPPDGEAAIVPPPRADHWRVRGGLRGLLRALRDGPKTPAGVSDTAVNASMNLTDDCIDMAESW